MRQMEAPCSWKIVKLVLLCRTERDQKLQAIALTSVMSKWFASCIILRLMKLQVGGIEGISCQHFQVLMSNLLQKHWELQEGRRPIIKHGSVIRPKNVLCEYGHQDSLRRGETKAHCTKYGGSQCPWMDYCKAGLQGQAMSESVESNFSFARCIRQQSVEAPRLWQKMAVCSSWQKWKRNGWGKERASF